MTTLPRPNGFRVLIADDDDAVQRLLTILFEREGWDVVRATNGIEALEMIRSHAPDAILLDLMMPDSSGFDVLRELRDLAPALLRQIIVLTAAAPNMIGDLGQFGEIWKMLRKPFDINELRGEVLACASQGPLTRRPASSAGGWPARTAP
ncbi:MAG TPA: response regulator [Thermoanaerobaculia bacterium]|jgi:CheY-like chemotaxis protein